MRLYLSLLLGLTSVHGATWLVPSVQPGTEIRITNKDAAPAILTFELSPNEGGMRPEPAYWTLAPGESRLFRNPLSEVLQTETLGTLRISSNAAVILSAKRLPVVEEGTLAEVGTATYVTWLGGGGEAVVSSIGVALLEPGTEVEVIVYGADGARTGSKVVSGSQTTVAIPLAELMPAGVGVARATFRARSGRALGFAEMVDAASGDALVFPASIKTAALGTVWLPVFRRGDLRTNMRLSNLNGSRNLSVRMTLGGVTKFVQVPAGATVVREDILGTVFEIAEDAAGLLSLTSLATTMELTAVQVGAGSIHVQEHLSEVAPLGEDQTGVLTGIDGGAKVMLSAGTEGARVSFRLRDATGAELAVTTEPLLLEASEYREMAWTELFAEVPEGASLELTVLSGAVAAAELAGPAARWAEPVVPGSCDAPYISSLRSVPDRLAAAGEIAVSWNTDGATQVSFSPTLSAGAVSGTASLQLTETTRIVMTASNACGSTTRDFVVAVGAPRISSVTRLSGAATIPQGEGEPGQMLRIGFENLDNGADVEMVIFKGANGDEHVASIDGATATGDLQIFVPFPTSSSAADSYQPGAYRIFASIRGVRTAQSWPFTIRPLTLPADPIAVFQEWVNNLSAMWRASVDRQRGVEEMAVVGDWQTATAGANEAILQNLARDLKLSDTATMPMAPTVAGLPAPPMVTVSRRSVGILMAYNQNLGEAERASVIPLSDAAIGFSTKGSVERTAATCLSAKMPALQICNAHEIFRRRMAPIADGLGGLLDFVGPVLEWAGKAGPAAVVSVAKMIYDSMDIACLVLPTRLDGFSVEPNALKFRPSRKYAIGQSVKVIATFKAWESKEAIAREGVATLKLQENTVLKQQVGACDLISVWGKDNIPGTDV